MIEGYKIKRTAQTIEPREYWLKGQYRELALMTKYRIRYRRASTARSTIERYLVQHVNAMLLIGKKISGRGIQCTS